MVGGVDPTKRTHFIIILCCNLGCLVEIILTSTEEELLAWTVDKLKSYLTTRGVTLQEGSQYRRGHSERWRRWKG